MTRTRNPTHRHATWGQLWLKRQSWISGMVAWMLVLAVPPCLGQSVLQPPATDATRQADDLSSVRPAAHDTARTYNLAGEMELRKYKQQALQSVLFSGGWIAETDNAGVSRTFAETSIGTGIPLGSFDNILGVTPGFRIDWIDAGPGIDIPDELYEFEIQFFYRRPLRERLSLLAILAPAIRSDLTTDDRAFRFFGLGLLNWECVPQHLKLSGGVVSLGRADLPVLPAVGLTWTPSPRSRLELQFPRSRLFQRLAKNGGESEVWAFMNLGIGGNTWAVTRESGLTDELSLRDLQLTVGLERLIDGGGNCFLETGFAFGREVEYERANESRELDNAWILAGGWTY